MIKDNFKIEKEEGKTYPPLPENIYQVQILDVNAEQRPTYDTRSKTADEQILENVLKFQYTLLAGQDGEEKLRGRNVWDNFVKASLYIGKKGKCPLYQIIESCLKRQLTQEEEMTFESNKVNKLVGMQLRIGTKHKESGGNIYDNVESYYPVESDLTPLTDEEKEEARVKKDKDGKDISTTRDNDPLGVKQEEEENQRKFEEEQGKTTTDRGTQYTPQEPSGEQISVENIPF